MSVFDELEQAYAVGGSLASSVSPPRARLAELDVLRGLVMVLMAVDHVRDDFGPTSSAPDNVVLTTPGWFSGLKRLRTCYDGRSGWTSTTSTSRRSRVSSQPSSQASSPAASTR